MSNFFKKLFGGNHGAASETVDSNVLKDNENCESEKITNWEQAIEKIGCHISECDRELAKNHAWFVFSENAIKILLQNLKSFEQYKDIAIIGMLISKIRRFTVLRNNLLNVLEVWENRKCKLISMKGNGEKILAGEWVCTDNAQTKEVLFEQAKALLDEVSVARAENEKQDVSEIANFHIFEEWLEEKLNYNAQIARFQGKSNAS